MDHKTLSPVVKLGRIKKINYPGKRMKLLLNKSRSILFLSFSSMLVFSSCQPSASIITEIENTMTATQEITPTNTPSFTTTLHPSPTATLEPTFTPTNTPVPDLSLVDDNLWMWSIPKDVFVMISESGISKDVYSTTYDGFIDETEMNIRVPASAVVVEVEFNQPLNEEVFFKIYDLNGSKPWYSEKIIQNSEKPSQGYTFLDHNFVIDPPFWEITYVGKLENIDGTVLWENNLRLYKALPNTCWDGSFPDPVTLFCPNYDGDWNYRDFPNFNPNADIFTSGQVELGEEYKD